MVEVENGGRENHPHRVERAAFARRSRWVARSTKRPGPLSDLWAPASIRTNVLLYIGQTDLTFPRNPLTECQVRLADVKKDVGPYGRCKEGRWSVYWVVPIDLIEARSTRCG